MVMKDKEPLKLGSTKKASKPRGTSLNKIIVVFMMIYRRLSGV